MNEWFNDTPAQNINRLLGVRQTVWQNNKITVDRKPIFYEHYIKNGVIFIQDLIGRKDIFYLTTQSTHFIYGYMASDIW